MRNQMKPIATTTRPVPAPSRPARGSAVMPGQAHGATHPHKNLGKWLHPKKGRG